MNNENYIVINGKKVELTEEQLKALGIEVEKKSNNPFNSKLKFEEKYYFTNIVDGVNSTSFEDEFDDGFIAAANSFNDKDFANQVYLHELLNRKLLKYAYDTNTISKWDDERDVYGDNLRLYFITKNVHIEICTVDYTVHRKHLNTVYFCSEKAAWDAIDKVIKPFEKEHPEFIW